MVFSGEEVAPRGTGHNGNVTGDNPDVIRSVTGTDIEGDDTGATKGKSRWRLEQKLRMCNPKRTRWSVDWV